MTTTTATAQIQPTATEVAQTASKATFVLAMVIVVGFAAGCLCFSFSHTIHLAHMLGATGTQAYTSPAFVDGFMLLGRLGMSPAFDASTRRIGRRMMTIGAILSLIANVAAGQTHGDRIIGALVVAGFLVTEWYAGKLKPAPAPELTPAQKAQITKARNAAARAAAGQPEKAPAKRKPATKTTGKPRTRKATTTVKPANAIVAAALAPYPNTPVSPAPYMAGQLLIARTPGQIKDLTS